MHQVGEPRPLKTNNNPKLKSVKFFHFNSQWNHSYENTKPFPTESDPTSHTNRQSLHKPQKHDSIQSNTRQKVQPICDSRFAQQTSKAYSKKKANSQLQSYKQLEISALPNRFSKPNESISHDSTLITLHKPEPQNQLIVNSIKLSALKLPEIKINSKQNHFIKKIKLQNLRVINIHDRIKTMKFTPEKQQDLSFTSQVTTQILKNKIKNISKLNKKFLEDRNKTEALQTQITSRQNNPQPQRIIKVSKKIFKKQDNFQENHSVPLKKFSKISSIKNIQNLPQKQKITTKQIEQSQENLNEKETSLPKIQNYDKKMKIGRKKKSQQDRIRALLLKTLQKTKGTDYVAQQGTSQKKNTPRDSMPQTKRSLSKQAQQASNDRASIVLADNSKCQQIPSKKSSLKRVQLEKLKKSLNPVNRTSETREPSTYIKNKKFVEMVREVENRKNKNDQLEEIKEEKTLSKQQNEGESNSDELRRVQLPQQASSEVSENEFLPNSARLKLKG